MAKVRLIDRLAGPEFGIPEKEVEAWILSARVYVGDTIARSAYIKIRATDEVRVKGLERKYVSRGGEKLEGALKAFGVSGLEGRVVIDCGSSTGGFVDCLLRHKAEKVYSVDAGYGQLSGRLRQEKRVTVFEKTNISDPELTRLSPAPEMATADLSYLSVLKSAGIISNILHDKGYIIHLVKPIYEIGREVSIEEMNEPSQLFSVLKSLIAGLAAQGFGIYGLSCSPITGSNSAVEFFLYLKCGKITTSISVTDENIRECVMDARNIHFCSAPFTGKNYCMPVQCSRKNIEHEEL